MNNNNKNYQNVYNFDVSNIKLSKAETFTYPVDFKRIRIGTKTSNSLRLCTDKVCSYVIDNKFGGRKSLMMYLYNRNEPTEYQKQFVQCLEQIIRHLTKYMKKNAKQLRLNDDLDLSSLGSCLSRRNNSPQLYAKLDFDFKNREYISYFCDGDNYITDLDSLADKPMYVKAELKIDSVFIDANGKATLQIKLCNAEILRTENPSVENDSVIDSDSDDSDF